LQAARDGRTGKALRGEEHEVQLVWSIKSGKTRVYWNKRNISNLFREGNRSGMVEFAWKSRSGETLQIVAHSEARPGVNQYDLMIDGVSFFKLPFLSELGAENAGSSSDEERGRREYGFEVQEQRGPDSWTSEQTTESADAMSDLASGHPLEDAPPEARDFRLSMVGLNSGQEAEVVDELRSDLYSPILESLRHQITACLPQTDEMVSKAIIDAFFVDHDSLHSSGSSSESCSSCDHDPNQIEADALWDAYEWVGLNIDYAPRPDAEELALSYMQKQIESMFVRVRNEVISSDDASRILLSVAAVLGLKFANSIPSVTVLFDGLSKFTTVDEVEEAVKAYGNVDAVAVVRGHGFAYCRFLEEESAQRIQQVAATELLSIDGVKPRAVVLSESLHDGLKERGNDMKEERKEVENERPATPEPAAGVPHLMAPLSGDFDECEMELELSPFTFIPEHSRPHMKQINSVKSVRSLDCDRSSFVSPHSVIEMLDHRRSSCPAALYSSPL